MKRKLTTMVICSLSAVLIWTGSNQWLDPRVDDARASLDAVKAQQCPKRTSDSDLLSLLTQCAEGTEEPLRYLAEANLLTSNTQTPLSSSRARVVDEWLFRVRERQSGAEVEKARSDLFNKGIPASLAFSVALCLVAVCGIVAIVAGSESE